MSSGSASIPNGTSNGETDPLVTNAEIPIQVPEDKTKGKKRTFAWGSLRFHMPSKRQLEAYVTPGRRMDAWCGLLHYCVESFVYLLGPVLICLATSIIGLLVYTFFTIMHPMMGLYYADAWYGGYVIGGHSLLVIYLMINVVWNYALCVCTSNINGKSYNKVMREMAMATGFVFPESPAEVEQFRKDYEDRMVLRMQCRRARAIEAANRKASAIAQGSKVDATTGSSADGQVTQRKNVQNTNGASGTANGINNTTQKGQTDVAPTSAQIRPWMMMGPLEWGFCPRTNQPKPPRSHYCHVSKGLVFCLDHYCPWMFNSVGYFNYRYFVNFLIFASVSMLYGASLSYTPFMLLSTTKYRDQLRANKRHHQVSNSHEPIPRMEPFLPYAHEKVYITLTFMLSLAVGLAVLMLTVFHIYLTLSSQTTIEFHGNMSNARRAKKMGRKWKNPYSFGALRNFQHVYGSQYHPLLAILIPSWREPDFLPIPLPGDQGKRSTYAGKNSSRNKGDFVV
ncbi:Palmitoyltransferase ZDHHC16A [Seminavis robusta]|uniref:Palmitoyltransferase n=1 Tax=Seminavis robusta TaxID=568900 RepID=A0A9N8EVN7_9STRA|nr:Palmitoyltransferase ZDHHC16A [Seminavis robusta]|eukprot:Sro1822_g299840.1 Palmitoyltransferase ZDHHC16A (508) ;mRNA; r:11777-13499